MANCANNCTSGSRSAVEINKTTSNYKATAFWGDPVSIGVDIKDNSWIIPDSVIVDLYNLDTGNCEDSTGIFDLPPGASKRIMINTKMPTSGNLNLRVSVSTFNLGVPIPPAGFVCQDFWEVSIKGVDPNVTRYDCVNNNCEAVKDGPYATKSDCDKDCSAGGSPKVVCSENDMNIMGICVPKPVVLGAFALGAIYIFKSSSS
jgi:hypothetical protein